MPTDKHPNERVILSKEVEEECGCNTHCKDLVYLQKDRLNESNETEVAMTYIYDTLTHNSKQIKETLMF